MSYNKKKAVTEIIQINKLFESSKNDKYKIINVIITRLFENDFNIYKKKVLNIIINTILYKKNINDDEENIILDIIDKIKNKNPVVNVIYYDILINIIDTIYLRKLIGKEKNEIIEKIHRRFPELNDYIAFASLESEISQQGIHTEEQQVQLEEYSKIKVYVYKVFHSNNQNNYQEKYSFPQGIKRSSVSSTYIKSKQNSNKKENGSLKYTIDNTKIYSKDIIASRNNNANENIYNLFNLNSNISKLYDLYKNMTTRSNLNKFIIDPSNLIYSNIHNLLDRSKSIMIEYFKNNCTNIPSNNIDNNSEIIYNINVPDNTKIIVMGDQHGSLHSFFRIFIRLRIQGIIKQDFKLLQDYKIIFLGDIIDRGNFGIEIMYIILKLITVNNTGNPNNLRSLNVILNRGNHEETATFHMYGFFGEITKKFPNTSGDIIKKFINLYSYCPSAIILKHKKINYWLCHGGFNIEDAVYPTHKIIVENNKCIYRDIGNNPSQIRWNDFVNVDVNSISHRTNSTYNIGTNTLSNFLLINNINFIIRGHTDNENNAMLLYTSRDEPNKMFLYLNTYENYEMSYSIFIPEKILDYGKINKKNYESNEEIVLIKPNLFDGTNNIDSLHMGITLYPVLTISNNSDIDRYQYDDSYIVIE